MNTPNPTRIRIRILNRYSVAIFRVQGRIRIDESGQEVHRTELAWIDTVAPWKLAARCRELGTNWKLSRED